MDLPLGFALVSYLLDYFTLGSQDGWRCDSTDWGRSEIDCEFHGQKREHEERTEEIGPLSRK